MYHIYSTTISMFLWVSDRWLFWSYFLAPPPPTSHSCQNVCHHWNQYANSSEHLCPFKIGQPLKSLNDVLKHQKPEAPPTEHVSTSPPPPYQLKSTSWSSLSCQKTMAIPANLDDGELMTSCLQGRIFTDYHTQVSVVIQVPGVIQVTCRNAKSLHLSNCGPL